MNEYNRKARHNDESRFATEMSSDALNLALQHDLAAYTGRKIVWRASGAVESTTAIPSLILGDHYHSKWLANGEMVLCYGQSGRGRNTKWEKLRTVMLTRSNGMPIIHGDIVFMRHGRSIRWDHETLHAEMLMFCQSEWGGDPMRQHYKFCH